ncbi:MAG: CvpA family protein [Candidatus Levyibacteriota bacterium]
MDSLGHLAQILKGFSSQLNFIDMLIIFVFVFYIIEGYAVGFVSGLIDFLSFLLSFLIALKYYAFFGGILIGIFSLSVGFSNALGFMLAAFLSEFVISLLLKKFVALSLVKVVYANLKIARLNNFLGILPGFLSSFIIITFFLTLIVSLPLSPSLKKSIFESNIGSSLVANAQGFEKQLNKVFGGAATDTLNFLTVEPRSGETLNLHFTTDKISVDRSAEQEMLNLLNTEREKQELEKLVFNEPLAEVGRRHCEDMFKRGYFSHDTPEGLSPFDRMDKADISYSYAGENLALAPNVVTAMRGLMESPGHKANILSPNFGRVGIGVIDGGVYGQMFCQEFSD